MAVDEGRSMTVDVLEGPLPAHDVKAVFTVSPLEEGRCEVGISMDYRPKFGPVGAVVNALAMRGKIEELLGKVLVGLSTHLESGALIGRDGVVEQARAS